MTYSKSVNQLAYNIIAEYSVYDELSELYYFHTSDAPDALLDKLVCRIMIENNELANEAISVDNDCYLTEMLPALQRYLNDTTNLGNQMDYLTIWNHGIRQYFMPTMKQLFADQMDEYTCDKNSKQNAHETSHHVGAY